MTGRGMTRLVWLVCLLSAVMVGCVSRAEYLELEAAHSQTYEKWKATEANLQKAKSENATVAMQLATTRESLRQGNVNITKLMDQNAKLEKLGQEYKRKYERLLDAGTGPSPVPAPVDAALKVLAQTEPELMEYMPTYGMLKLKADLTFDKGSAIVKPGAVAALKKLAEIVNTRDAKPFHIYVAGHTDDIPIKRDETIQLHGSNWGLSCHRALRVIEALFKAGVEQKRMGGMGFSMYHPIAPNAPGKKGNPLNRRVEIWIVPPGRFLTATGQE